MGVRIDRNLALARQTDRERWANPDALEPAWDARARIAASLIPANSRVLDLGCGRMALRQYLRPGCSYRGCDLVARDAETVVCDFNGGDFPQQAAAEADIVSMLGVLEYIVDVEAFFTQLKRTPCTVLMSYCVTDLSAGSDRAGLGWINHFSLKDLIKRFGYKFEQARQIDKLQVLLLFAPA
jgi:hypothetical protein